MCGRYAYSGAKKLKRFVFTRAAQSIASGTGKTAAAASVQKLLLKHCW